jgi:hypothetical protein
MTVRRALGGIGSIETRTSGGQRGEGVASDLSLHDAPLYSVILLEG